MKSKPIAPIVTAMFLLFAVLSIPSAASADLRRAQTIELKEGWNSVFLEIVPDDPSLDAVFAQTPVTMAAAYYPKNSSVSFIQDPDEKPWKKEGWGQWVPADRPEAIINDLFILQSNHSYLLYSTADYVLYLSGSSDFRLPDWKPDSFNFLGFYVDSDDPPTFSQYFEGSKAHGARIYRLEENHWKIVAYPGIDKIKPGEAYWVWCDGPSSYPGPLQIDIPGSGRGLYFYQAITRLRFSFENRSESPLSFTLELMPNLGGDPAVPLWILHKTSFLEEELVPFTTYAPAVPLQPGEEEKIELFVRRASFNVDEVSSLMKVTDGFGDLYYLEVWAEK